MNANAKAAGLAVSHQSTDKLVQWSLAAATVFLVFAPIVPVLLQAVIDRPIYEDGWTLTLSNFTNLSGTSDFSGMIFNTAVFAAITVVVSQVVGGIAAVLIGRTDLPGRSLYGDLFMWPLFVSHLILGFGWLLLYGPAGFVTQWVGGNWNLYSLAGMGLAAGIAQAPITYIYCVYGTGHAIDPNLEDAARICGAHPWTVIRQVTLPLMKPSLIYSGMLNLIVAIEMLSIPLMLGDPANLTVFSSFLYKEGIAAIRPDFGLVGAAATILLIVVSLLVWLQLKLLGDQSKYETIKGKASRPKRIALGRAKWPLSFAMAAYCAVFIVMPLGAVIVRSFTEFLTPLLAPWTVLTLDYYGSVFSQPSYVRAVVNTIVLSVGAAGLGTLFFALVAIVIKRSEFRFPSALETVATLPRAVPGIIAGLGVLFAAAVFPPLEWMRGTVWILGFAYTMTSIPIGISLILPALIQINADLDKSARVSGASWWMAATRIVLPILKPTLFGCFALLFIIHLKTYVTALALFSPGSEVMGTMMLFLWGAGDTGLVAAFATIQIVTTIIFVTSARRIFKVNIYG